MTSDVFTNTKRVESLITDIKHDLLVLIAEYIKQQAISEAEAQQIASNFLQLLPVQTESELLHKFFTLTSSSRVARLVFLKYATVCDEVKRQSLPPRMTNWITRGSVEKALLLAKDPAFAKGGEMT